MMQPSDDGLGQSSDATSQGLRGGLTSSDRLEVSEVNDDTDVRIATTSTPSQPIPGKRKAPDGTVTTPPSRSTSTVAAEAAKHTAENDDAPRPRQPDTWQRRRQDGDGDEDDPFGDEIEIVDPPRNAIAPSSFPEEEIEGEMLDFEGVEVGEDGITRSIVKDSDDADEEAHERRLAGRKPGDVWALYEQGTGLPRWYCQLLAADVRYMCNW